MSFDQLGLTPELLRAVADQGYTEPTPVQAQAIPHILAGRDILAGAQTGTGKTAAFVLPILQYLHGRPAPGAPLVASPSAGARPAYGQPPVHAVRPGQQPARGGRPGPRPARVLVLVPTRELALQVEESVRTYGAQRPVRSVPVYGGVGYEPQFRALRNGPEIVVATPGRLLDHIGQRTVDLSAIEILVLDEADRMLDMGFIRDIRRILELLPAQRQNLLFSATFNDEIRSLASAFLHEPALVQATPRNTASNLVRQVVIRVDRERKRDLLRELVASGRVDQALVFTRTKHGANRLAEQLVNDGISAAAIHGNRSQSQRVRALNDFKAGKVQMLVATEVAARGIDIEELPHVVNYELPMVPEDYLHRIGRTGRAGSTGDAISLVCVDEGSLLRDIERLLGRPIEVEIVPGFEPDRAIRPQPILLRTGQGGGRPSFGASRGPIGAPRAPRTESGPAHVARRRPAAGPGGRPNAPVGPRPFAPATGRPHGPSAGRPQGTSIGRSPSVGFGAPAPRQQAPWRSDAQATRHPGSGTGRPLNGGGRPGAGRPVTGGDRPANGPGRSAPMPGERLARFGDRPRDRTA